MITSNLSELYNNNAHHILGYNNEWLKKLRTDIIRSIENYGLPNKKKEIWKYANLEHVNNFTYKNISTKLKLDKNSAGENIINFINGRFQIPNSIGKPIDLKNLSENLDLFKNYFIYNDEHFEKDFVIDLNTIFLTDGIALSVEENQESFVIINYQNVSDNASSYIRNIIKLNKNSKLTLVENFTNSKCTNDSSNIFNNFWLEDNSKIDHYIIENSSKNSNILYSSLAYCYKKSNFNQLLFQCGSKSIKSNQTMNLLGEESSGNNYGIYFGKGDQFIDNKTSVIHHKENCKSNQIYKGVLKDSSKGVYLSKTTVKPEAQKTQGYQLSKGILLSDSCKLNNKPELKIYADDVKCSHGSTTGSLDKEQLFYLKSRGLIQKEAEKILIKSFYQDIIKKFDEKNTKKKIDEMVDNWLKI